MAGGAGFPSWGEVAGWLAVEFVQCVRMEVEGGVEAIGAGFELGDGAVGGLVLMGGVIAEGGVIGVAEVEGEATEAAGEASAKGVEMADDLLCGLEGEVLISLGVGEGAVGSEAMDEGHWGRCGWGSFGELRLTTKITKDTKRGLGG